MKSENHEKIAAARKKCLLVISCTFSFELSKRCEGIPNVSQGASVMKMFSARNESLYLNVSLEFLWLVGRNVLRVARCWTSVTLIN